MTNITPPKSLSYDDEIEWLSKLAIPEMRYIAIDLPTEAKEKIETGIVAILEEDEQENLLRKYQGHDGLAPEIDQQILKLVEDEAPYVIEAVKAGQRDRREILVKNSPNGASFQGDKKRLPIAEAWLGALVLAGGYELNSNETSNLGRTFSDLTPDPKKKDEESSAGFAKRFSAHTDDVWSEKTPNILGFSVIQGDADAKTRFYDESAILKELVRNDIARLNSTSPPPSETSLVRALTIAGFVHHSGPQDTNKIELVAPVIDRDERNNIRFRLNMAGSEPNNNKGNEAKRLTILDEIKSNHKSLAGNMERALGALSNMLNDKQYYEDVALQTGDTVVTPNKIHGRGVFVPKENNPRLVVRCYGNFRDDGLKR